MKIEKEFMLLKAESKKTKSGDKSYFVIYCLDEDLVPCQFFSFNEDINTVILEALTSNNLVAMQKILIKFDLFFSRNMWNCNLINVDFKY